MLENKYVVKGFDINHDVVLSVVCVIHDLYCILDTVKDFEEVCSIKVNYLDPEFKSVIENINEE